MLQLTAGTRFPSDFPGKGVAREGYLPETGD
jgi:hypothetical protein